MHWGDRVSNATSAHGPLILGIDPDPALSPDALANGPNFLDSATEILLDVATGSVGFVKFQSAHYEAWGSAGLASLARGMKSARERGLGVILDAKRGDIGSTAEAYARAYLTPGTSDLEADCLTVNPFLGPETVEPFLERAREMGKGVLVLVKTSNPGSGWLQDQRIETGTVSERVAGAVARWADQTIGNTGVGAVGAVVGATYAGQALALRAAMPRSVFLIPGLGAQGGDAAASAALATPTGPVLVSASRGVAAVDDAKMPLDDYRLILRDRVYTFQQSLRVAPLPS